MAAPQLRPRERGHYQDPPFAHVLTTEAGGSPHRHCVAVDARGRGYSSPGPDGHVHLVDELDVWPAAGHTHELSADRCARKHAGRSCLAR